MILCCYGDGRHFEKMKIVARLPICCEIKVEIAAISFI